MASEDCQTHPDYALLTASEDRQTHPENDDLTPSERYFRPDLRRLNGEPVRTESRQITVVRMPLVDNYYYY